jgi:nicotinamidase-related amidase
MKFKVELEVPNIIDVVHDPGKTAIVVIDLENEFCDARGKLYLGQAAADAVYASAALIERGRNAGNRIIWVQSARERDAIEFAAFDRDPHLIDGTWSVQFSPPLNVLDGEPVIKKHSHDCFNHTNLDAYLEQNGIIGPEWLMIVVGVGLDVCVNHAVLGFSVRNYRVAVPLDCTAPREGPEAIATLWRYGAGFLDQDGRPIARLGPIYPFNITITESKRIIFESATLVRTEFPLTANETR